MYEENTIPQLIKVVGVGGGGGNAVSMMHSQGAVRGVSFLVCNTDRQAFSNNSVEHRVLLGPNRTRGLGAGNRPEVAREAAEESVDEIRSAMMGDDTRMVFITAGMGGGTGTGAAPVVGRVAMEAGLLTVGIVTIPFLFEGKQKILQALRGVDEMRKHVDALLVINNERLLEVYPNLELDKAFEMADNTLSWAARGISDIVNIAGKMNLDFADVEETLKAGGVAVINTGMASGTGRIARAIEEALRSPLLNNKNVHLANKLLLNVYQSSSSPLSTGELQEVRLFTERFSDQVRVIWGYATRDDLGDQVAVTILASGFDYNEDDYNDFVSKTDSHSFEAADAAKRQKEEDKRIAEIYGKKAVSNRQAAPLYLRLAELDDEDLILILEEQSPLKRDRTIFDRKRTEQDELRPVRIATQSSDTLAAAAWQPQSAYSSISEAEAQDRPSASAVPSEAARDTQPQEQPAEDDESQVIRF